MIFAASQRLSVSVVMKTITTDAGSDDRQSASTHRSASPEEAGSRARRMRCMPRRSVPVMVSASAPSVSKPTIVIRTAKPAIQSRMRPTGYHSITGVAGAAPLSDPACGQPARPSNARWPSHHAGSATVTTKAMQEGRPSITPRIDAAAMPPIGCRDRSPSECCHHQRQRRQVEQQQCDQRARDRAERRDGEANISADAEPAASAMSVITIISCPAPFERLEVL